MPGLQNSQPRNSHWAGVVLGEGLGLLLGLKPGGRAGELRGQEQGSPAVAPTTLPVWLPVGEGPLGLSGRGPPSGKVMALSPKGP